MEPATREENMMSAPTELEEEITVSPGHQSPKKALPARNALSKLVGSDSESENDVPTQAPRGKLLTRLQPQRAEESSESEEDDDGEGAYARIRSALMSGKDLKRPNSEAQQKPASTQNSSSEDEDDMPVRGTVRRTFPPKDRTPSAESTSSRSAISRRSSPGLFVTPTATPTKKTTLSTPRDESDSDVPTRRDTNKDLQERVKRIRAQRLAEEVREKEQARKAINARSRADEDADSDPDGENGRRLTQNTRPARKAGKKALEEMARDQQRISRNMQLAHQAKTKKKYTTKDLFSRFGFNQPETETVGLKSTVDSSDVEMNQQHDTPPTSPPSEPDLEKTSSNLNSESIQENNDATTKIASAPASPPLAKVNKGKGRATEFQHLPPNAAESPRALHVRHAEVNAKQPAARDMVELSDSEDDLEVVKPKSRFPVFDRMPQRKQQEAPSLLHLRHLAHLTSPSKKLPKGKSGVNLSDLQFSLVQKARQQAHGVRQERIEELKRRGVHIETEEEREKHQMEVEDLIAQFEKARQEDLKLAKYERAEAKKDGEGGDGLASSDESGDEDYVASGEEDAKDVDALADEDEATEELSGSEDEDIEDADDEEEGDEDPAEKSNALVDDAAEEDEDDEGEPEETIGIDGTAEDEQRDEEDIAVPVRKPAVKRGRKLVIDDDDESEEEPQQTMPPTAKPAAPSQTQQDDAMAAAFGFGQANSDLGFTQMFAGTMADLDSDSQPARTVDNDQEQDSLDFLRALPDSQPPAPFTQQVDTLVPNSQALESQEKAPNVQPVSQLNLNISQLIETSPSFSHTQLSQDYEPTQDVGFKLLRSPDGVVPPPSTIETVMMPVAESPVMKRKGKLQQGRRAIVAELSDVDDDVAASGSEDGKEATVKIADAWAVLKKGAKKQDRIDNFNKKTSWARDAIEEQAEESEDEYAGIGGADDDDSGEEDEEIKKMIDESDVKVDERQLAAFFAEKAKKEDEKGLNQLYKDVMNGGLRKRHAAGAFDVSDSEDEHEQQRRKKQAQFRQMTKALIADEKIASVANNPKKSAFFNTLADHFEDPEYDFDFLEPAAMGLADESSESQSQSQPQEASATQDESLIGEPAIPDSQTCTTTTAPISINPLKRKSPDSQDKENRPPPNLRRTAAPNAMARKPITIQDIQHSVSELLDDPRIMVPDSQFGYDSDSDLEIEDAPAAIKAAARRPKAIIDRLTLSRQSTIEETATTAGTTGMAFVAPSAGAVPGFRVPSLIRRATSNMSRVSENGVSSGASTPTEGSGVRRGGTGRSNIHAQAREAERRAAIDKSEMRRKEQIRRKVKMGRGQRSVLGGLDGGFE